MPTFPLKLKLLLAFGPSDLDQLTAFRPSSLTLSLFDLFRRSFFLSFQPSSLLSSSALSAIWPFRLSSPLSALESTPCNLSRSGSSLPQAHLAWMAHSPLLLSPSRRASRDAANQASTEKLPCPVLVLWWRCRPFANQFEQKCNLTSPWRTHLHTK